MRITFGSEKIEIRHWGAEDSGKALLVTNAEGLKRDLLKIREVHPEMVELMTDPDAAEVALDDVEGAMMAVVDRKYIALFFDLEKLMSGVCHYECGEEGLEDEL